MVVELASRSWWSTRGGFVVQHVLALRNVTLRCRLVELPATMRTLNVVAGIADRWWWKVTQSSTCRQMCLNLLRCANRIYELFVFASPIRLNIRFLRFIGLFLWTFLRERFQIRTLNPVHRCIELFPFLLYGFRTNSFMEAHTILCKTTSAYLTGDQIICGILIGHAFNGRAPFGSRCTGDRSPRSRCHSSSRVGNVSLCCTTTGRGRGRGRRSSGGRR